MRKIFAIALAAAIAVPALAAPRGDDIATGSETLFASIQSERFRMEGERGRAYRPAIKHLKKGEKALRRFMDRYESTSVLDAKNAKFMRKLGVSLQRARKTGKLDADGAVLTDFTAWVDACQAGADALSADAALEIDRLFDARGQARVARRHEKGVAYLDGVEGETDDGARIDRLARAIPHISKALGKAIKLCHKETQPRCPGGLIARNNVLTFRGRGTVTVYDLTWDLEVRTAAGVFYVNRTGHLGATGTVLDDPLPWSLRRGDSIDGAGFGQFERQGYRVDGTFTWRTSVGEIVVPVHLDP